MICLMLYLIAGLALAVMPAVAAVPQQINYQGYLTDTDGEALDTTVAMTFSFYDAATLGTLLWMETQPACSVREGLFNVMLGSVNAIPDSVFADTNVWLGITVGGDSEMSPRTRVVSVAYAYRVGTVDGASGGTISGKVNIGLGNTNAGSYAFVVGENNTTSGDYATAGGGYGSSAGGSYATVSGGRYNDASFNYATVSGGYANDAGYMASVGGGSTNSAGGSYAMVGGGQCNRARGDYSFVAGGGGSSLSDSNSAIGDYSAIGGGSQNTASGIYAVVSGGFDNKADTSYASVGGGRSNDASGWYATVGGGVGNEASDWFATVSGGQYNDATNGLSTVGGGYNNDAIGGSSTVGGGFGNVAGGSAATVGGGYGNVANGDYSTVSGGRINVATGSYTTVSGGYNNTASGAYSTVAGGASNMCSGDGTFVCGNNANTAQDSCFVFNDGRYSGSIGAQPRRFIAIASNGVYFLSNETATTGVALPAGASAWVALCDSTKKHRYGRVNSSEILNKLARLPIETWSYKEDPKGILHIGPMAQDFWKLFHLGEDSLGISTIDPDGIALAAIQELKIRTDEIERLNAKVERLETLLQNLLASRGQNGYVLTTFSD